MSGVWSPNSNSGSNIEISSSLRNTSALHEAVQAGNMARVRELINAGLPVNSRTSNNKWTPLMFAAAKGNVNMIRLLLNKGANARAKEPETYMTPLIIAAHQNHVPALRALIPHSNIDAADINNRTALILAAAGNRDPAAARLLLRAGAKITPAMAAYNAGRGNQWRNLITEMMVRRGAAQRIIRKFHTGIRTGLAGVKARRAALGHRVVSKWRRGPVQPVPMPNNAPKAPISLHNFKKGHEAIRHTRRNASGRSVNRYYTLNEFQSLARKSWPTIYRMKPSDLVVGRDPMDRQRIYRRNLTLVKFS